MATHLASVRRRAGLVAPADGLPLSSSCLLRRGGVGGQEGRCSSGDVASVCPFRNSARLSLSLSLPSSWKAAKRGCCPCLETPQPPK